MIVRTGSESGSPLKRLILSDWMLLAGLHYSKRAVICNVQ